MTAVRRSISALLFLFLGVSLPFLVVDILIVERVSVGGAGGIWGHFLLAGVILHVLTVVWLIYGHPLLKQRFQNGLQKWLVGLATLAAAYAASIVGLVRLW